MVTETKARMILAMLLVIQIAFFAYGFYALIASSDAFGKAMGVFIMVSNFVFGAMNIHTLLND